MDTVEKDPWQQRWEDVQHTRQHVASDTSVTSVVGAPAYVLMDEDEATCIREQLIGEAWEAEWACEERTERLVRGNA